MAETRFSEYRGYEVQTLVVSRERSHMSICVFRSITSTLDDRTVHTVDGMFGSPDAAHEAALKLARELIDRRQGSETVDNDN